MISSRTITFRSNALESIRECTTESRFSAGRNYYSTKRVVLSFGSDDLAQFFVAGSVVYRTEIKWQRNSTYFYEIHLKCDCPDFTENEFICKHIVASALYLNDHNESFKILSPSGRKHHDVKEQQDKIHTTQRSSTIINQSEDQLGEFERLRRLNKIASEIRLHQSEKNPRIVKGNQPEPLIQAWYQLVDQSRQKGLPPVIRLKKKAMNPKGQFTGGLQKLELPPTRAGVRGLNYVDDVDFKVIDEIVASRTVLMDGFYYQMYQRRIDEFVLPEYGTIELIAKIIATGRCLFLPPDKKHSSSGKNHLTLFYSPEKNWRIYFKVLQQNTGEFCINAAFRAAAREVPLNECICLSDFKFAVLRSGEVLNLSSLDHEILTITKALIQGELRGNHQELSDIIYFLLTRSTQGEFEIEGGDLSISESPPLTPKISLLRSGENDDSDRIPAVISMNYGDQSFRPGVSPAGWNVQNKEKMTFYYRDFDAENTYIQNLVAENTNLLFINNSEINFNLTVQREALVESILQAIDSGWSVELQGKPVRSSKNFNIEISSGIDWFDVHVHADLGEGPLLGDDLLRLLKSRDKFTVLADGSYALNSNKDIYKNSLILERFANNAKANTFRIPKLHGILLELEESNSAKINLDKDMRRFLDGIKALGSLKEATPGTWFKGTLRPYQAEGLDWLRTLRDCQLGGCLADDMGLGKTVQVLALLSEHYGTKSKRKRQPTLLIVPRSLVFNWQRESEKFAPELRVSELTHSSKIDLAKTAKESDIFIATYHMTRRELETLLNHEFEYIILDEAQNIKNPDSLISRSVKALKANYRLALSGTPVENHLSDITSIFEFLNPGLCSGKEFHKSMVSLGQSVSGRQMIGRVLKPFVLRRTKAQVLKDLPQKTETIIYCEPTDEEKRFYDNLAKSVRAALKSEIKTQGIGKTQIHILAALTKLRQAACDVRLVHKKPSDVCGTKIELLLDRLKELGAEGQKAVVFSQFTEFLALAKARFDEEKIPYCYLDGQTKNREGVVNLFNSDPLVPVFFVSLKAGGVGLNLTSASNCFLLDPWWNPAAEAQAIDRIHRIGQKHPVFAYRMIARGTVEEKILALQAQKRDLSDSIINGSDEEARAISLKDLEILIG